MMQAIIQDSYGAPEHVMKPAQVERPSAGEHDVLIQVRATSVNTPDWAAVTGVPYVTRLMNGLLRPSKPIRGTDVAGFVEEVGDRVTTFNPGDEVFGSLPDRAPGTYAEYAVAPESRLIMKPAALSFEAAGASIMSGITAMAAMRYVGKVGPGASVLINGASGGVGTFAVQIATSLGAEVTGVCGPTNIELVRSLGAEHVIDYTQEDFTKGERRFDVILDNVMNHPASATARVLDRDGILIPNSLGNTGGLFAGLPRMAGAGLKGLGSTNVKFVTIKVNQETLAALASLLESGQVSAVIDRVYPLNEAAAAVAHMLGHHAKGKVVIAT